MFRDDPQGRRFLLLDYGSHWDYPKGHVEAGEDDLTAARRELREETGIFDIHLIQDYAKQIEYFFRGRNKGGLIKKAVVFFLARTDQSHVTLSSEHVGYAWATESEALAKLSYTNAKAILKQAIEHLQHPL